MNRDLVSVVVVNYNKKKQLYSCLESVLNQTYPDIEVILIDNFSSDGSVDMVKENFPEVRILRNKENMFLAKPYNQGIRESKSDIILCMNNDVVLDKDYIKEALVAFDKDHRIGSVTGKLMNPITALIDSTGQVLTPARRGYERGYRKKDKNSYREGYVWGAGGAAALYRREMLEDISIESQYFDESYKAYLEDLDLNWRSSRRGWRSYFRPSASAFHSRGTTAWKRSSCFGFLNLDDNLKVQYLKNRYATLLKNESLYGYIKNLFYISCYDGYLLILLISIRPLCILYLVKDTSWLKSAIKKRAIIKKRWPN
jgi:GT2 family glycosyltransferase